VSNSAQIFISLLWFSTLGHAAEPPNYYTPAAGLSGPALRSALHFIIDQHTVTPYSSTAPDTRDALNVLDQDPTNSANVILVYGSGSRAKSLFGNGTGNWDREHLWPNSYGIDDESPMYSDLVNLRPCDSPVNNDRSNNYYDESSPAGPGYENPANPLAPACSEMSNVSWEPPSNLKGDIARIMFYMDIRYEGDNGEANLQLTDNTTLITTTGMHMGKLSTLLVWHFLDPVDQIERIRNDLNYTSYQRNRNPFVDRPEWVEKIYGDVFKLQIAAESANTLRLTWPLVIPDGMWSLETSTTLTSWQSMTVTPSISGSNRTITVTNTGVNLFFLLKLKEKAG
jgi:endonuclease I